MVKSIGQNLATPFKVAGTAIAGAAKTSATAINNNKVNIAKGTAYGVGVLTVLGGGAALTALVLSKMFNMDISMIPYNELLNNNYVVLGLAGGTAVALVGTTAATVVFFKNRQLNKVEARANQAAQGAQGAVNFLNEQLNMFARKLAPQHDGVRQALEAFDGADLPNKQAAWDAVVVAVAQIQ
jgi:hypothetical protein